MSDCKHLKTHYRFKQKQKMNIVVCEVCGSRISARDKIVQLQSQLSEVVAERGALKEAAQNYMDSEVTGRDVQGARALLLELILPTTTPEKLP